MQFLYFIANFISIALAVLELAMLARAILSWVVMMTEGGGGGIYGFLSLITEPIIWPFRKLFDRFGVGEDMPIDLPFLAAFMTLSLLGFFI
jgi:uncharacterized protein YggT (Ycf19 family)